MAKKKKSIDQGNIGSVVNFFFSLCHCSLLHRHSPSSDPSVVPFHVFCAFLGQEYGGPVSLTTHPLPYEWYYDGYGYSTGYIVLFLCSAFQKKKKEQEEKRK